MHNILEKHYREVQDFEFTIEQGKLYMLQTRNGKMNAWALVKTSVDMVKEGLITEEEALLRIEPDMLEQFLHRRIDPDFKHRAPGRGHVRLSGRGHRARWCSTPTGPRGWAMKARRSS